MSDDRSLYFDGTQPVSTCKPTLGCRVSAHVARVGTRTAGSDILRKHVDIRNIRRFFDWPD